MEFLNRASKIVPALFAVLTLSASGAHALGLGIPFGFGNNTTFGAAKSGDWDGWGNDVGLRIHISDMFALQPTVSLCFTGDSTSTTNIGFNADFLFYLFESNGIKEYLGANVGANSADDTNFRIGGIFGLQHSVTSAVDLFGQIGLGIRFEPSRLYTVNTQVGLIFYIAK